MTIRKLLKKGGLVIVAGLFLFTGIGIYQNITTYESVKDWFYDVEACPLAKKVLKDLEKKGVADSLFFGHYGAKLGVKYFLKDYCQKE
ncbi:MAG: hypothetical protein U9Q69_04075 [Nanoarchaeota archaeon]|nr:hypothetical protein [Nanoarchaeota archaeon]